MSRLLGGDSGYSGLEHISKIDFGTDGTAASLTDTALGASQFTKAAAIDYPAHNQVRFVTTMQDNEGGSYTYQELGLLTDATNKLFSRVVISPITKSSAYRIEVEWVISFQ